MNYHQHDHATHRSEKTDRRIWYAGSSSGCCERCGGLMIGERCMDIGESLGGYWFWAMRCIQCGDIVDEVILRNRCRPQEQVTQEVVQAA
jgi:hypothetical protein